MSWTGSWDRAGDSVRRHSLQEPPFWHGETAAEHSSISVLQVVPVHPGSQMQVKEPKLLCKEIYKINLGASPTLSKLVEKFLFVNSVASIEHSPVHTIVNKLCPVAVACIKLCAMHFSVLEQVAVAAIMPAISVSEVTLIAAYRLFSMLSGAIR